MKSPKFQARSKELSSIFHPTDVKQTWKNKVRYALRGSPIPDPIDYLDYHINITTVSQSISSALTDGTYKPSANVRVLLEKSKGLCRQIVIVNPIDAIVLQRLSDRIWPEIKKNAPSKQAFFEPDDHKFSKNLKELFSDPSYGGFRAWLAFQKALFGFAQVRNYMVVTDIANYYDFINYHHLRNILSSYISEKNETIIDTLIYSLSGMLWQPDYMPRVEMGLPQLPLTAPRLLAHCFLYETDEFLKTKDGIDFVRFMDDIDIGVDTLLDAKKIARDLDLVLHTRQVRLNSGKTRILTKHEAVVHFRIRENYFLDVLQDHVNWKIKNGISLSREKRILNSWLSKQHKNKKFDSGNGEKILKRIITTIRKINGIVPRGIVEDCVTNRPSVRANVFEYIKQAGISRFYLSLVSGDIAKNYVIDDNSALLLAELYVESRTRYSRDLKKSAIEVISWLSKVSPIGLFSSIWMASKFYDSRELSNFVAYTYDGWKDNALILRLVSSIAPFLEEKAYSLVQRCVSSSPFYEARSAFDFQIFARTDRNAFGSLKNQISASNPTKPLKITHSKFIVIMYIVSNELVKDSNKISIIKNHKEAFKDKFYLNILKNASINPILRKKLLSIL